MSERLKKYEFFKHCLRLKAQGFTGTVVIERGDGNTVVRFDGGVPYHAASEDVTLSFAGLLIRRALLDPSTLKQLLEESLEQHVKLETLLVDQGRMTSKEVWKTKRELSSLVFQHAFTVDDVPMRLVPGDSPDEEALAARSELEVYETLFRAVMLAPDRNVFLGLFRDRWDEVLEKTADFYRHMLRFRSVAYGEDIVAHLMEGEPTGRRVLSVVSDKEGALAKLFALTYCGMLTFQGAASREVLPRPFMGAEPLVASQAPVQSAPAMLTEEQASVTSELQALAKAASRRGPREEYDAAYGRVSVQPERRVAITEDRLNVEVVREEVARQAQNIGVPESEIRETLGTGATEAKGVITQALLPGEGAPSEAPALRETTASLEVLEDEEEAPAAPKQTLVGMGDALRDLELSDESFEMEPTPGQLKPTVEFGREEISEVIREADAGAVAQEAAAAEMESVEVGLPSVLDVAEVPAEGGSGVETSSADQAVVNEALPSEPEPEAAEPALEQAGAVGVLPETPAPETPAPEMPAPEMEEMVIPIEEELGASAPVPSSGSSELDDLGAALSRAMAESDAQVQAVTRGEVIQELWQNPQTDAMVAQQVPMTRAHAEEPAQAPVQPYQEWTPPAETPQPMQQVVPQEPAAPYQQPVQQVVPQPQQPAQQPVQQPVAPTGTPLYVGGKPVGNLESAQPAAQTGAPAQPAASSRNVTEAELNAMIDQAMAQAAFAVTSSSIPAVQLPPAESETPELEVDHAGSEGFEKSGESEEDEQALATLMSGLPQVPPKPDTPELGTDESIERILEDVYRSMLQRTLYELLNVTPLSPLSAVRDATQRLRNKYAPTQYRGFLMSKRAHRILKLVREAVDRAEQVLTHLKSRRHYDEMLSTPYPLERSVWLHQIFHAERDFQAGLKAVSSKEFSRAVEMLGRAVTSNPNDPDYVAWRGYALYQKQKTGMWEDPNAMARVRADFEKALTLDPRHGKSLLFLARLEDQFENIEAAMGWYAKLQKLEPGNEEAAEALERLRRMAAERKNGDQGGWLKFKGMFNKKK